MTLRNLLNLVFPQLCLNCRKNVKDGVICRDCFAGISINQTLFCGRCQARLPAGKKTCHQNFPYILGAAGSYDNDAIKSLIHGLKFKYIRGASLVLGKLLYKYTSSLAIPLNNFIVIPLPLSKKRLRGRGFNQSELIAQTFAEHFELSFEKSCLLRTKNAEPQSKAVSLIERRKNVEGCFAVIRPKLIAGKNIILIDDVTTSGATFFEAAKTLKGAGAKKIIALAVART